MELIKYLGDFYIVLILIFIFTAFIGIYIEAMDSVLNERMSVDEAFLSIKKRFRFNDGSHTEDIKGIINNPSESFISKVVSLILIYPVMMLITFFLARLKLLWVLLKLGVKLRNFWVLTIKKEYPECDLDIPY